MPSGELTGGQMYQSLAARLASPAQLRSFPLIVALSSVVLALPALGAGWILDDYLHRTIFLEHPEFRDLLGPPGEMFRFFRGDPVRTGRAMDIGIYPWWTDRTLKAEFLQAITVLTHRLDYMLWPDSPALMHAQSLFWLGTAVFAVAAYYRQILGATCVATVAALLYAVDDARGTTVGFIANRNVLIAVTFGAWALVCHDRYRRGGSYIAALAAPLLLAAALFSKEEGIGTCAYLAAYGLFRDLHGRWRGCLALVPYAVVVIVWRTLRASWGYGVHNMGLHVDPLTDPGPFVAAVVERTDHLVGSVESDTRRNRGVAASAVARLVLVGCGRACRFALLCDHSPAPPRSHGPFLGSRYDLRDDPGVRNISDGSALDLCRHRCVRIARPVLGICVRQIKGRARSRWWRMDRVFRNERRPMADGQEVKLTGMTARVTVLTADRRPAVATFRFDEPLESPSYVWLCYRGTSYEPFVPPSVGIETRIAFELRAVFTPPGLGQGESRSR